MLAGFCLAGEDRFVIVANVASLVIVFVNFGGAEMFILCIKTRLVVHIVKMGCITVASMCR